MKEFLKYLQVIKKAAFRTFFILIFIFFILLTSLIGALRLPAVQTYLAQYFTEQLSTVLQQSVTVKAVNVSWFDKLVLEEVTVKDTLGTKMIYVKDLVADFDLFSLVGPKKLTIENVLLNGASVQLQTVNAKGSININQFVNRIAELTDTGDTTKTVGKPFEAIIETIELRDSYFSMDDDTEAHQDDRGFDQYHFGFRDVNARISDFRVASDTFEIDIKDLRCVGIKHSVAITELDAFFRISSHRMTLSKLKAQVADCFVQDSLVFSYDSYRSFKEFNNEVSMYMRLDSTVLSTEVLGIFAPPLKQYTDRWTITGNASGTVNSFAVKKMDLSFGKNSRVKGYASLDGLPSFMSTFMQFKLKSAKVDTRDLHQYLGNQSFYPYLAKFGTFNGALKFTGFPLDFVADSKLNSALGSFKTDINLKVKDNPALSTYEGHLITHAFDLGKLIDKQDVVQKVDLDGQLTGKGFTESSLSVTLDAVVSRLGIDQYDYKNIVVNGSIREKKYFGFLIVNDPNLVFNGDGSLDLSSKHWKIDMSLNLEKANIDKLGYSTTPFSISSLANLNVAQSEGNFISGAADMSHTEILYDNRYLEIDSINFFSDSDQKDKKIHNFQLQSDFIDFVAKGDFKLATLIDDLPVLWKELRLSLSNNQQKIEQYYTSKQPLENAYSFDFNADLKDINPVLKIFVPDVFISPETYANGSFVYSDSVKFNFKTNVDEFRYKTYGFKKLNVKFDSFKEASQYHTFANLYIKSEQSMVSNQPIVKDIDITAIWQDLHIDLNGSVAQVKLNNNAKLDSDIDFRNNGNIEIHNNKLDINIDTVTWSMPEDNLLIINGKELNFKNYALVEGERRIDVNGIISEDPQQILDFSAKHFDLSMVNIFTKLQLGGVLNADVRLSDVYKNLDTEAHILIDSLHVEGGLIGNIDANINWDNNIKVSKIDASLSRENQKVLTLLGTVNNKEPENQLNLQAKFDNTNLVIVEPFIKDFASNVGGVVAGELSITGKILEPVILGTLDVKGIFKINYLNTVYRFIDKVYFHESDITVKNLKLFDATNNYAVINGGLYHDNFRAFVVDLKGKCRNFEVLKTQLVNNELFYGTAIATGKFSILGPFDNLAIAGDLTSNKGTKFYIPLNGSATVEQSEFIRFVNKAHTDKSVDSDTIAPSVSGISLDMNIHVTPEAYGEIIFDPRSGDIIRGNGSADLKLNVDTKGDFILSGKYVIQHGTYNFTMANLVDKKFTIEPGGSITWSGDPYGGILDMKALYEQNTTLFSTLRPGVSVSKQDTVNLNQRATAVVEMKLTGNLLAPDIGLGITIKNYLPEVHTYVVDFLNRMRSSDQELNKQVFSLMVLKKFTPEGSFGSAGAVAGASLSEMFSNQLSNWISQVDENLQIDILLNGMDKDALQNARARLSYMVLDGKVKLTTDAGQINTGTANSSFAVDWQIEYMILPNGNLRLKMYNKTRSNPIGGVGNNANTITGFSLLSTKSFDNLMELFGKKIEEKKTEEENSDDQNPDPKKDDKPTSLHPVHFLPHRRSSVVIPLQNNSAN